MSERQSGHYARLEGLDGVGKSKQMMLAQQYSDEHNLHALFIREPGGTSLGVDIRHLLLTNKEHDLSPVVEFLLFTADRVHLQNTVILPALEQGRPVISDRGVESTIAYQPAGGGISKEMIMNVSSQLLVPRYMKPDGLAILSLNEVVRQKRLKDRFVATAADKIELRDDGYTKRVYDAYKELENLEHAQVVDADRTPEEIFEDLKPILFGKFAQ